MKYCSELVKQICDLIEEGVFAKDACLCVDISEETYYRWKRPTLADGSPNPEYKPEFSESIKKAEANRKSNLIQSIKRDRSWQSKAWMLERLHRDEYAERKEFTGKGGEGLKVILLEEYLSKPNEKGNDQYQVKPAEPIKWDSEKETDSIIEQVAEETSEPKGGEGGRTEPARPDEPEQPRNIEADPDTVIFED